MAAKKKKSDTVKPKKAVKKAEGKKRGRKPTGVKKVPYVLYITEDLKKAIQEYAAKKDLYLTDVGEALLSRGLRRN